MSNVATPLAFQGTSSGGLKELFFFATTAWDSLAFCADACHEETDSSVERKMRNLCMKSFTYCDYYGHKHYIEIHCGKFFAFEQHPPKGLISKHLLCTTTTNTSFVFTAAYIPFNFGT